MTQEKCIAPPISFQERAHIHSMAQYHTMYQRSIQDPDGFWAEMAEPFHWHRPWTQVRSGDFHNDVQIRWFEGAQTNLCYNALDHQIAQGHGEKVAILWEGNEPGEQTQYTYSQVLTEVCRIANVLKQQGVQKGDRVTLYMPMIPELAFAMLACARIGAIHNIVFGGFSAESLSSRILDARSNVLFTADGCMRGKKPIRLKQTADQAIAICAEQGHEVRRVLVVNRTQGTLDCPMQEGRDLWWQDCRDAASEECPPTWMDAEDPLFILYTSGSTGKPKGVLHTNAGYMVYAATTFKYVFD
ncbi:MAG: AMP-binding protein, partial [Myxococcota bacterium]